MRSVAFAGAAAVGHDVRFRNGNRPSATCRGIPAPSIHPSQSQQGTIAKHLRFLIKRIFACPPPLTSSPAFGFSYVGLAGPRILQKEKNAEEFAARARAMQFARGAVQAAVPSRRCPRRRTALLLPAAGVQSAPQKEIGPNARMGWAICVKCVSGSIGISLSYAAKSEKTEPCN